SGGLRWSRFARVVNLADHDIKAVPLLGVNVLGQVSRRDVMAHFERKNVEPRKHGREEQEWRREQKQVVEVLETEKGSRGADGGYAQKNLVGRKWVRVIKDGSRNHR